MAETDRFTVHSAARGPRWIGWVTLPGETRPWREVVVVAANREDAEVRAQTWAEHQVKVDGPPAAGSTGQPE